MGASFAAASALPLVARRLAGRQNWFHPLVMPVAYVALALMVPLAYIVATHRPVAAVTPAQVSAVLVGALALTVVGFVLGILASLGCVSPASGADVPRRWDRVLLSGRAMLALAILLRAYSTLRGWGTPYGRGSVDFGTNGTIQTLTDFLSFTGPALIVVAQVRLRGVMAVRIDVLMFGVFTLITLVSGSRGELLAPVIFALWVYHRDVGHISLRSVVIGCVAIVLLFQAVQGVRSGESPLGTPTAGIERTLTAVGVPVQVTSLTTRNVPAVADHRLGGTYVESLKRQLPGAVAVKLWGPPNDTATFVLRRILGFNTPDGGLGYALPAESYLNFGLGGTLVIALLVGLLIGYAYQKQVGLPPSRAVHLLYGFLIASLPLSLRGDAVLQIKTVLYPMIAVALVFGVWRAREPQASKPPAGSIKRLRGLRALLK